MSDKACDISLELTDTETEQDKLEITTDMDEKEEVDIDTTKVATIATTGRQSLDDEETGDTERTDSEDTGSTDTGSTTKRAQESVAEETPRILPKRVRDMYTTADWWTLWIGLLSFGLATAIVFIVPFKINTDRAKYVIPQPMPWNSNPFDAWDLYGTVGIILLLHLFGAWYLMAKYFMGKIDAEKPFSMYAKGFLAIGLVAVVSFWLGRQEWCARNGFGYAIFAIVFGMIIANIPLGNGDRIPDRLPWLKLVSKDGEFFIKSSLVLLAVEFVVLKRVGVEAIIVAWVGSPVALVSGFLVGTRLFKMNADITLLVAVGSTWCGASAISAVAAIVGSSSADISLSISVVAFFTVVFTFVQAYIAMGTGIPDNVAGAWIGGSIDQTGNVIASAAIISEEATEIAGIVKIVLNSGLGILATIIACWWQTRREGNEEKKRIDLLFIWDKFPKFVLGYLLCSGILTVVLPILEGTAEGSALQRAVSTLNKWWFSIAFVGIGASTSIKELWEGAVKSGIIKLYLATNLLDIVIALGLAYAVFPEDKTALSI